MVTKHTIDGTTRSLVPVPAGLRRTTVPKKIVGIIHIKDESYVWAIPDVIFGMDSHSPHKVRAIAMEIGRKTGLIPTQDVPCKDFEGSVIHYVDGYLFFDSVGKFAMCLGIKNNVSMALDSIPIDDFMKKLGVVADGVRGGGNSKIQIDKEKLTIAYEGLDDIPLQSTGYGELRLTLVPKSDTMFAAIHDANFSHPASAIMGRQLNYLVEKGSKVIGIVGVNSPPTNYIPFREFFKIKKDSRILNNGIFKLLLPEFGFEVVKLLMKAAPSDFKTKYSEGLIGMTTFSDFQLSDKYTRNGWSYIGVTKGKPKRAIFAKVIGKQ
jgi:hypothetical protein